MGSDYPTETGEGSGLLCAVYNACQGLQGDDQHLFGCFPSKMSHFLLSQQNQGLVRQREREEKTAVHASRHIELLKPEVLSSDGLLES